MIFAIIDYLNYRTRRGPYSRAAIEAEGGLLATKGNFPFPERLDTGDIVFVHTVGSKLSWLVMYYTSSVWSHSASATENGYLLDATTDGVIEHPFSDYLDEKSYILRKTLVKDLSSNERQKMLEFGRSQIGAGYNWIGVVRLLMCTILGRHANYRVRYTLDFLILAACLAPVALVFRPIALAIGMTVVAYLVIVVVSTPVRREMHRRFGSQLGGVGD